MSGKNDLDKAKKRLEEFLERNPKMKEYQAELDTKLSGLSSEDRLLYLAKELKSKLKLLQKAVNEFNSKDDSGSDIEFH